MPAVKLDFTRSSDAGPCEQGATFRRRVLPVLEQEPEILPVAQVQQEL